MESKNLEKGQLEEISDKALDLVLKDYEVVKDLYTQSESAIQSLFNFYLTVLSAIIAGLIFVFQVGAYDVGIVAGLLIFAIAVGIFYQSGIVGKYADQAIYAKTINDVRSLFLKLLSEEKIPVYKLPLRSPVSKQLTSAIDRWEKKMWWLFPVGTHQLFIAFINSVCLSLLVWVTFIYAELVASRLWQGILISFLVFWLGIIANDSYAVIKLNREIIKHGEVMPSWSDDESLKVSDKLDSSIQNTQEQSPQLNETTLAPIAKDEAG